MLNRRRAAALAALVWAAAACSVTDDDIEHWKHTQRGPRKITTVLVEARYPQPLRVHAARALIEMRHPNASGLELLGSAMQAMPTAEREGVVHALLPELQQMMNNSGASASPTPSEGPSEPQIKAKDAAYVLLRGDGHASFASAEDRATLAGNLLDWVLSDFNRRALAGSFTAEQVVNAIGPTAADRLTRALTPDDNAIPVAVEIARLINTVGTPSGKQAAVAQLVRDAQDIAGAGANERLRARARALLNPGTRAIDDATIARATEQVRTQYLTLLFTAMQTLAQSNGSDYLLTVAANATAPIERRRQALAAMQGAVSASNIPALLAIVDACPPNAAPSTGPQCDVDLRGTAIDRIGDTRDRAVLPQLYQRFDTSNGIAADQSFSIRWKLGESIIRLGGNGEINAFMEHLGRARPAPFAGYTFAELNGEAQALGDIAPPPRAALRGFARASNPQPVRLLSMMFLGIKGEAADVALLTGFVGEATAITGEGWGDQQMTTVGAVATRSRDNLQQALPRAAAPTAAGQ